MELVVWSSGALVGLAGWWLLLRKTPHGLGGRAPAGEWNAGDAVLCVVLALYFIAGIFADTGELPQLTADAVRGGLYGYLLIVGLLAAIVFARGQTPQRAFGLAPAKPLRAIGLGMLCIVLTYPLVQLAEQAAALWGPSASEGDGMVQYLRGKLSASDTAWAVALAVVVAPLTEELVFRGYFYGVIRKYAGRLGALPTSALLFAAVHHNLPALPALALLALGLSLAYELTGSLWTPIVMHMCFNLVPVVVILRFPEWISHP